MVRIFGTTIPDSKKLPFGLAYVYGVGIPLGKKIVQDLGLNPDMRIKDLNPQEVNKIQEYIEKRWKVGGDLRRELQMTVKRLKDIGSYRGLRHMKRLPARGQRTKTNSRTVRGNVRKTLTSGRKKAPTPT